MFILCSPLQSPWERSDQGRAGAHAGHLLLPTGCSWCQDEIHSDLIFHGKKHPHGPRSAKGRPPAGHQLHLRKTFNLAGLQASTTVFPEHGAKADIRWLLVRHGHPPQQRLQLRGHGGRVQREARSGWSRFWNTFPETSTTSGTIVPNIPEIKPSVPDATYLVWLDCRALGLDDEALKRSSWSRRRSWV